VSGTFKGVFNILATPFSNDLAVDDASLRNLVEFQLDKGAYGLTILGVLGEASKLTVEERTHVMHLVMQTVAGRVPVIVGASHQEQATVVSLARTALQAGAAAVMIAPPRFAEPIHANVLAYYEQICAALGEGEIVLQDFPPVTNVVLSADLIAALAERVPTIHALKLEDPPLMQKIAAVQARTERLAIFGGLGGMFFLEELMRGAAGMMTGFAFTEILVAVYQAFTVGDQDRAAAIFDRYLPLIRFENQPLINLAIRKELLYLRGAIKTPLLREPFAGIDGGTHNEIASMLRRTAIGDPRERLIF